jgi:hypothetical protein
LSQLNPSIGVLKTAIWDFEVRLMVFLVTKIEALLSANSDHQYYIKKEVKEE